MARGTMHAPKPGAARRNAPTFNAATVTDDGVLRGPELEGVWSPGTLAWYEDWRRSPMAQLFLATDWRRLALLAPMVEKHLASPSAAAMSEIRMNEERLGATYSDRLRSRIIVADDAPVAPVTPIRAASKADVKARLGGASTTAQPREETPSDEPGF